MTVAAGQDLHLSRTVIGGPGRAGRALRGPFRLRLASACRRDALGIQRVPTTQPRTRTDSMSPTLVAGGPRRKRWRSKIPARRTRPGARRRRVAATVAIPATSRPTASRARWASRAVAPVVRTSSQTTNRSRRPASRRSRAGRAVHRARQVGGAASRVEAGLVGHAPRETSSRARSRRTPCRAAGAPRSRVMRVRRVVAAGTGRAGPRGHRDQHAPAPGGRGRRRGGEQPGRAAAQGEDAALLVGDAPSTGPAVVRPRPPRGWPGPPGAGVGHAGCGAVGNVAVAGPGTAAARVGRTRRSGRRAPGRRRRHAPARCTGRRSQAAVDSASVSTGAAARPLVSMAAVAALSRRSRAADRRVDATGRRCRRGSGRASPARVTANRLSLCTGEPASAGHRAAERGQQAVRARRRAVDRDGAHLEQLAGQAVQDGDRGRRAPARCRGPRRPAVALPGDAAGAASRSTTRPGRRGRSGSPSAGRPRARARPRPAGSRRGRRGSGSPAGR